MAEKEKNPHAGHRKRLRDAYLRGGFEALSDVNRLELLLFYAFRQGDTNPLAHKLLDHFGSLSGVLDADIEQLMQVDGIGESSAILIRLIDRETSHTSYQVVQEFRGKFRAFFYQGFARLWGYNLKTEYDPHANPEDDEIETIMTLLERGVI